MKLLQNSKFTGMALILLLVLNTSLLLFILFRHPGPPPPPRGDRGGPREFLIHELDLDEQQRNAYDVLIRDHRAAVESLEEDIRANREILVNELENPAADSGAIASAAKKIGEDQQQLEKVTFEHFRKVRAICHPQQQLKFDKVIKEALHIMGPPPREEGKRQ